jgi:hypothetical protein
MSLGEFSILTAELDNEYNDMAAAFTNSVIDSNTVRDDYIDKWTSEVNSKKTSAVRRYIVIYTAINAKINNLVNYLGAEIEKETLAYKSIKP